MKTLPILLLFVLLLTACSSAPQVSPTGPGNSTPAALTISSPDFGNNEMIPQKSTCQGDDSSPQLVWSSAPEGTQSFALLMDDPDVPVSPWVHWIVYNIPADARELPEGQPKTSSANPNLPAGSIEGPTSFNRRGYGGPCPPVGSHHYRFHLYALDTTLPTDKPLDKAALLKAIQGHVLAQGELVGLYQKQ